MTFREIAEMRRRIDDSKNVAALRDFALYVLSALHPTLLDDGTHPLDGERYDLDEDDDHQWDGGDELEVIDERLHGLREEILR